MSALPSEKHHEDVDTTGDGETVLKATPVVVRRHAGLAALIGAGASAVAIAYLWRASQSTLALDWTLCAVMAVVATVYLATFVDSRTPLLVADDLGVRIRLGREWRGLPWDAISQVVVRPRRGWFRDGGIVLVPQSLARALEGLDGKGRRHAGLNQKMYGAPLAVPLGITTRVSTKGEQSIAGEIASLTLGRAEVVEVATQPTPVVEPAPVVEPVETPTPVEPVPAVEPALLVEPVETPAPSEEQRIPRRKLLGDLGTIVSRVGKGRRNDVDVEAVSTADTAPPSADSPALPLRETRPALRAQVTRDLQPTLLDAGARSAVPEGREMRRPGSVNLVIESDRVRPISTMGDPVDPLVIDEFVTEPAYNPIVGPELAASRTRLGLSVDDLAERTRIRPHVIESIEVDDFAPCGGDFYARGHLRTLARVLGKDSAPLLQAFEERYATAPVNARRVFEAELATGMTGSMRSTIGGPNWGLLVGVVLALVMAWGAARLLAEEPAELLQQPTPVLNGSAGIDQTYPSAEKPAPTPTKPLPVMLVAAHADSQVVVRNGDGKIVFSGEMVLGEKKRLDVAPPVRVRAEDGGAIEVVVKRKDKGVLGELGEPGRRTFRAR